MNGSEKIRVFLAYPEKIVLDGLKGLLNEKPNLQVIGSISCENELIERIGMFQPDILLLSSKLVRLQNELIARVRITHPAVRIILLVPKMVPGAYQEGFYLSGISSLIAANNCDSASLSLVIQKVMEQHLYISPDVMKLLVFSEEASPLPVNECKPNASTHTEGGGVWYTNFA